MTKSYGAVRPPSAPQRDQTSSKTGGLGLATLQDLNQDLFEGAFYTGSRLGRRWGSLHLPSFETVTEEGLEFEAGKEKAQQDIDGIIEAQVAGTRVTMTERKDIKVKERSTLRGVLRDDLEEDTIIEAQFAEQEREGT